MFSGKIKWRLGPLKYLLAIFLINLYLIWRQYASPKHKNPHDYQYLINPESSICGHHDVSLLIMVTSGLKHQERRQAIRETWGSDLNLGKHSAKIVFLLGTTEFPDSALEKEVKSEMNENGDIVREDFLDSYQNLTLKTIAGVKWASQFCQQAKFLMKTDDDMYLNLDNIQEYLFREHKTSQKVITGCVKNDPNGPHKPLSANGKPAPALPFKSVHPLFMAGAGYVISGDLITPLYEASLDITLVKVEDAFLTGYCARRVGGVRKIHHEKFSCGELVNTDCEMTKKFSGHKVTPSRMRKIHQSIEEGTC